MINPALLDDKVQEFIRNYTGSLSTLAFAGSPFAEISIQELLQQIESRNKIEKKLPTWFNAPNIIYPPKLNLEQTSSEITASYKASIIEGTDIADITGGFGVDSYFFSKRFEKVEYFENNGQVSQIAVHNFKALERNNIQCFHTDGLKGIEGKQYSAIYADPSRRNINKGKVFFLEHCEPDVAKNSPFLLSHCQTLLIKTSPMLDISIGLGELANVQEVHIVAVENEVKELLWILTRETEKNIQIKTVNFVKTRPEHFDFGWGQDAIPEYDLPQKYLYEPNAAILKSGAFNIVGSRYNLAKLDKNTHLFTSEELVDFPGRSFVVEAVFPYNKESMRTLNCKKANITVRNFPESVSTIRKKWKIKEGGNLYLFFTTSEKKRLVVLCKKMN